MRRSRFQSLTRFGPISGFTTLGVISNLSKLHAFISNLNNSGVFWSITAIVFGVFQNFKICISRNYISKVRAKMMFCTVFKAGINIDSPIHV